MFFQKSKWASQCWPTIKSRPGNATWKMPQPQLAVFPPKSFRKNVSAIRMHMLYCISIYIYILYCMSISTSICTCIYIRSYTHTYPYLYLYLHLCLYHIYVYIYIYRGPGMTCTHMATNSIRPCRITIDDRQMENFLKNTSTCLWSTNPLVD